MRRVEVMEFLRFGIQVDTLAAFDPAAEQRALVQDVSVARVNDPDYGDGELEISQEVGIFLYVTSRLNRVRVRSVGVAGVAVGETQLGVAEAALSHVDVDGTGLDPLRDGVGVYFEKGNFGSTLTHFCVGKNGQRGVNVEWDGNAPPTPASPNVDVSVRRGLIQTDTVGVWIDAGAIGTHLETLLIRNAEWAGVGHHLDVGTTACGLDFQDLGAAACEQTEEHYQPSAPPPMSCAVALPCP